MEKRCVRMGINKLSLLATYISRVVPGVDKIVVHDDTIVCSLQKEYLPLACKILNTHSVLKLSSLMDIWGVDYPERSDRFEVNYMLLSTKYNFRLILRVNLREFEGIDSVTAIFNSAGWLEREVWDMYGVMFFNHKDLRRILTDYGFDGHPLRKDFPLSGFMEVRYDDGEKRVVYEPLEVAQEYRSFNFKSPWERL